jgi:hypothetical protein
MILPKVRDPRFVTIRRGGTLTDSDHQLLALWAASCAEHVLHFFELARQRPAGWWALRVDPRCLLAAFDRGDRAIIPVGVEQRHGCLGEVAAFA